MQDLPNMARCENFQQLDNFVSFHPHMNKMGYDKAKIDKVTHDYDANRGREQFLINLNGGAKSQGGTRKCNKWN